MQMFFFLYSYHFNYFNFGAGRICRGHGLVLQAQFGAQAAACGE
jgi:hypothetical protein